ncbi:MAG: hypothetical protein ABIT38_04865 [Gemmatimonadaceae bacterium]
MNVESKSGAILLVTLSIGVALGMVMQGALQRGRSQQTDDLRRPQGFVAHMTDVIQPRVDQGEAVHSALQLTADRNQKIIDSARTRLRAELEAMQHILATVLDEAQRQRLANIAQLPDPFRPPLPRDDRPPGTGDGGPPGGPPGRERGLPSGPPQEPPRGPTPGTLRGNPPR